MSDLLAANDYVNQIAANKGRGNAVQRNALDEIKGVLQQFGLPASLGDWAWTEMQAGASKAQILLDLYKRPEFETRFPAIVAAIKAGKDPITPGQYIEYETKAHQAATAAGLPPGLMNHGYIDALMQGQVALPELEQRIKDGFQAVNQSDPNVRKAFSQYFGVNGDQALAAYFLDPKHTTPLLLQQARAAEVAGEGQSMIGGWISQDRAMQLAAKGLDYGSARAGFSQLQNLAPLFDASVSEQNNLSIDDQGLSAVFGIAGAPKRDGRAGDMGATRGEANTVANPVGTPGTPGSTGSAADAQREIEARRQARTAAFKGGGEELQGRDGIVGFGSGYES